MAGRNPQHRVLVVGAGSIGERHIRCFLATGRCDVSFVEVNEALRQTIAVRYSARGFASLEEGIATHPEIAVVATPAHLHIDMAMKLAEAGIHLLIEKPLSTNEAGVQQLTSLVHAKHVVAGVAYVYRSHPILTDMRKTIASGTFGPPVQIVVVAGQHFPTYRPAYREIYYRDRATGGGAIQDALTHLINAGEWLVGPVTRLVADAAHQVLPGVEVEDTVHILTRHGNVLGSYNLNQHQAPNETNVTVICERGTARFEVHENRWRWMTAPGGEWQEGLLQLVERDELFTRQADLFLDAVERNGPATCSLPDGLQTLRVNLAALKSCETATWQSIMQDFNGTENDPRAN
ncbi:MAG: Gfo/Idh/MocA family oxidoreductase [Pirellulaceae bacterium]|nr:Gfo/Idh/MocA family oxidoreductase [Pirellulaceae bacterium]